MNKVFLAAAIIFGLTGSAFADHKASHKSKTFTPGAVVTSKGIAVTAPTGADVDVDVDGNDIEIDVSPKTRGLLGVGFLGL
jgi:hypothetical protein